MTESTEALRVDFGEVGLEEERSARRRVSAERGGSVREERVAKWESGGEEVHGNVLAGSVGGEVDESGVLKVSAHVVDRDHEELADLSGSDERG